MKLYEVLARKWENGWELQVEGTGQTWSPSLADAEARAREYIIANTDTTETVHVTLVPRVDGDADRLALEARRAVEQADEATRAAAAKTQEAVRALATAGLSEADIASFLDIPQARLAQLVTERATEESRGAGLPQRRR